MTAHHDEPKTEAVVDNQDTSIESREFAETMSALSDCCTINEMDGILTVVFEKKTQRATEKGDDAPQNIVEIVFASYFALRRTIIPELIAGWKDFVLITTSFLAAISVAQLYGYEFTSAPFSFLSDNIEHFFKSVFDAVLKVFRLDVQVSEEVKVLTVTSLLILTMVARGRATGALNIFPSREQLKRSFAAAKQAWQITLGSDVSSKLNSVSRNLEDKLEVHKKLFEMTGPGFVFCKRRKRYLLMQQLRAINRRLRRSETELKKSKTVRKEAMEESWLWINTGFSSYVPLLIYFFSLFLATWFISPILDPFQIEVSALTVVGAVLALTAKLVYVLGGGLLAIYPRVLAAMAVTVGAVVMADLMYAALIT